MICLSCKLQELFAVFGGCVEVLFACGESCWSDEEIRTECKRIKTVDLYTRGRHRRTFPQVPESSPIDYTHRCEPSIESSRSQRKGRECCGPCFRRNMCCKHPVMASRCFQQLRLTESNGRFQHLPRTCSQPAAADCLANSPNSIQIVIRNFFQQPGNFLLYSRGMPIAAIKHLHVPPNAAKPFS